jgi:hypothetical protein
MIHTGISDILPLNDANQAPDLSILLYFSVVPELIPILIAPNP